MPFFVYILKCSDSSYYTGHTDNLEKRLSEHTQGTLPSCYTFNRRPIHLVFHQSLVTREEALAAEQQIKGWSRSKKEAMMRGDWQEVSKLARTRTNPVRPELVEGSQSKDEQETPFDRSTSSRLSAQRKQGVEP